MKGLKGVPMKITAMAVVLAAQFALGATDSEQATSGKYTPRFAGQQDTYVPWTFPGINVMSPVGFGANWGNVFVGGSFTNRARRATDADGALAAGFGIGNANKYVGLEASVGVFSVTNANGSRAFDRGGFNFKVHRNLPYSIAIAAGSESLLGWGTGYDANRSYYGTVTKVFFIRDPQAWFSAVTLTGGVGNNRFRSEANVLAGNAGVNAFGSAAVRILQPVSFITDWSGQDLNLGLSLTPFRKVGIVINPSLLDVTRNAGDGVRFMVTAGYGYNFNS